MWLDRDTYNAQQAQDFEESTPDPFQPARDALQFARDTAGGFAPSKWLEDARAFAESTAGGFGDALGKAGEAVGAGVDAVGTAFQVGGGQMGQYAADVAGALGVEDPRRVSTEEEITQARIRANAGLPLNPRAAPIAGAIQRNIVQGAPTREETFFGALDQGKDFGQAVETGKAGAEKYAEANPSGEFIAENLSPLALPSEAIRAVGAAAGAAKGLSAAGVAFGGLKQAGKAAEAATPLHGPQTEAGLREFWDRTRNVIAAQGPAGQELAQKVYGSREIAERTAGGWVAAMPTVRSLNKLDFDEFVDAAEGTVAPVTPAVIKAMGEWSAVRDQIWNAAKSAGIDVGKQRDYFPHIFEEGTFTRKQEFDKAVKHLVASGQAKTPAEAEQIMYRFQDVSRRKHGNLESSRIAELPGYKRDKEALFGYIESAADRIGQAAMFGPKYEESTKLLTKIRKSGFDDGAAKHAFDVATGSQLYGQKAAKLSQAVRAYNVVTKLGLSAVANATQSINTATVAGAMRTIHNLPDAFGDKEAADYALKIGTTLDGVINDLREGAGFSGKFAKKVGAPGFASVEKFNRTLAALAGREMAIDEAAKAAKGDAAAMRRLGEMGLDANEIAARGGELTQGEIDRAARKMVERTQFKVDPQDLPVWMDSPWGKLIGQFRTFSYNQSAFIGREVIGPALSGDVGPLMRFLILAPVAGAASSELRNLIANRPSEEDPTKRVLQYFQKAGGLGIVSDLMTALAPQNVQYLDKNRYATLAMGALGGPTVGTLSEALGSGAEAWQGRPTNLERFGLRQVPIVGSTLQNTVLPYKQGGRAGTGESEGNPVKSLLEQRRKSSPVREFLKSRSK